MAASQYKHLVIVKFKEDAQVEEILKGLEKLCLSIDSIKSYHCGEDVGNNETLRQGFTHVFSMTFEKKEDYDAFATHPDHVEFSGVFLNAIEKILVLDFPLQQIKP